MKNFGPNTDAVNGVIEQAKKITAAEAEKLAAAWDAIRDTAQHDSWDSTRVPIWLAARVPALGRTVRDAAWGAALATEAAAARYSPWGIAWGTAGHAAGYAAQAAAVRDLIPEEDYETLVGPWESVMGPIFPEDES